MSVPVPTAAMPTSTAIFGTLTSTTSTTLPGNADLNALLLYLTVQSTFGPLNCSVNAHVYSRLILVTPYVTLVTHNFRSAV